jgi:hypothetical protein
LILHSETLRWIAVPSASVNSIARLGFSLSFFQTLRAKEYKWRRYLQGIALVHPSLQPRNHSTDAGKTHAFSFSKKDNMKIVRDCPENAFVDRQQHHYTYRTW